MKVLLHLPDTSLPNIPRCCDYYWHSKRRGRLKCSPPLYLLTNLDFQKIKTKTNKQVGWRAVNIWIQLPSYFKSNFTELWCHFSPPTQFELVSVPWILITECSVFSCIFWVFFFFWKELKEYPLSSHIVQGIWHPLFLMPKLLWKMAKAKERNCRSGDTACRNSICLYLDQAMMQRTVLCS